MQLVTTVEECEGKCLQLYNGWREDYAAGWHKLPNVGFLQFTWAALYCVYTGQSLRNRLLQPIASCLQYGQLVAPTIARIKHV
jgi:hypothetical protein